jgi:hypothetical protein
VSLFQSEGELSDERETTTSEAVHGNTVLFIAELVECILHNAERLK